MARHENERSCIVCVKGCQIFSLFLRLFRWILELFRQYGCFFSLYMLKLEFIQFDRITTHFMMNGKESHTYVFLNNAEYWVHYRKMF